MKTILLLCAIGLFSASSHSALYSKYIDNPETVGNARLEVLFWDIYDAELIAENGSWDQQKPFALKLTYLRKFKGKDIASRSIDEMRDLGVEDEIKLAKWFEQMQSLFPDVSDGSSIIGIADKGVSYFYFNQNKLGQIDDAEFTKWFFAIWLDENTSEPKLRNQLLGLR